MAYDVFISHSSVDKNVADATCSYLERNGIRCWIAPRDIQPGANWGGAIIKAIRSCRVMVLIFSSHANSSEQIKREVERAVSVGATVIPMRIEEVMPQDDLDYFLSAAHWLDAISPPLETHLERLAQAIKELLAALPAARPDSATTDIPDVAPPVVLHAVVPSEPPPVKHTPPPAPPPVYVAPPAPPPVYSAPHTPPAPPVPPRTIPPPAPKSQRTWLVPALIGLAVLGLFGAGISLLLLLGSAANSDHKNTPPTQDTAAVTKDTPLDEVQRRADAGESDAEFELGYRYDMGNGVQQDYAQAIDWYQKAAAQGDATAENNLGYLFMNGLGVNKDYNQAYAWYQKAADGGSDSAENNIGYMYQNGYGVTRDYTQALNWYQKAAAAGNSSAQNSIGYFYQNGWGVEKNFGQAFAWYQKAATQGNNSAENNLGYLYQNGDGVDQNYSQALDWYNKSADKGNSSAMFNIAYMYENGLGVDKDINTAVTWYRKAAAAGDDDAPASLQRLGYSVNP